MGRRGHRESAEGVWIVSARAYSACQHWQVVDFGPDYFGICGAAKELVGAEPLPATVMVVDEHPGTLTRLWTRCDFSCQAFEEKK